MIHELTSPVNSLRNGDTTACAGHRSARCVRLTSNLHLPIFFDMQKIARSGIPARWLHLSRLF
jgi:hypothetical protein